MSEVKRVVVLRDFSYEERPGEEELAIERFMLAQPDHIDTLIFTPEATKGNELPAADILITFGLKTYPEDIFDYVLGHKHHIHIAQDWWEPTQPNSEYRNKVVEAAKCVVFQSPMHKSRYERLYCLEKYPTAIIPFPMLGSDYATPDEPTVKEEPGAVLWHAPWHPDYGNDLLMSWAIRNNREVHAYGMEVPKGKLSSFVEGMGDIPLDSAASRYMQYEEFVYFPRKPIPFGFSILLATTLGLRITTSGEIGCKSYADFGQASLKQWCAEAPRAFWSLVDEAAA